MRNFIGYHLHWAVYVVTTEGLGEAFPCAEQLIDHVSGPAFTRQEYQSASGRCMGWEIRKRPSGSHRVSVGTWPIACCFLQSEVT